MQPASNASTLKTNTQTLLEQNAHFPHRINLLAFAFSHGPKFPEITSTATTVLVLTHAVCGVVPCPSHDGQGRHSHRHPFSRGKPRPVVLRIILTRSNYMDR